MRNASLRQLLVEKHVNLKESRLIECHFWADSQTSAEALADALRSRGFRILVQRKAVTSDSTYPWNVEAEVIQSVDLTISRDFTEELVKLAASHNGRYDGWGTRI